MESLPEDLRPEQYKSLTEVITDIAERHGDRPAFTCLGKTLSYGEMDALSARFAHYLQARTGLEPGDRFAIQLPNLLQFPVALFGALRAGLVVVNTNPLYTPNEMAHQFKDAGVKGIIILEAMCSKLESVMEECEIETVIIARPGDLQNPLKGLFLNLGSRYIKRMVPSYSLPGSIKFKQTIKSAADPADFRPSSKEDDVALILYTGGTTGVAKGAMLSHNNLIANMMQLRSRCLLVMEDGCETVGAPLPMYHSYAFLLHCLVLPFGGNHNVLIPDPRDLDNVLGLWKKYRFSGFVGINTLYLALLRHSRFDRLDFGRLRFCGAGGMAMSSSVLREWEERTGQEILEGYGLTECSPVVAVNIPGKIKAGTVGPAVPETEICAVNDDNETVGTNEQGELWVRGPQVMLGYWQQRKATAEAITEAGWFKTGDYVTIDEDGYIKIVDRKKDMILVSGFNVFPNEVEDWINNHPDVLESAAVGVDDPHSGEVVKLFVVRRSPGLSEGDVIAHARKGLTAYKRPNEVVFVKELPKSNIGKILRRELR